MPSLSRTRMGLNKPLSPGFCKGKTAANLLERVQAIMQSMITEPHGLRPCQIIQCHVCNCTTVKGVTMSADHQKSPLDCILSPRTSMQADMVQRLMKKPRVQAGPGPAGRAEGLTVAT